MSEPERHTHTHHYGIGKYLDRGLDIWCTIGLGLIAFMFLSFLGAMVQDHLGTLIILTIFLLVSVKGFRWANRSQ